MKKILITGKNSYIGNSFKKWANQWAEEYQVDKVDTRDDAWKQNDFSKYDTILHVAGIAHIKETKENQSLYYQVNRDLAVDIAKKAKKEGIKQFILLSSMSVYGLTTGVIDELTPLTPKLAYGKSKLEAEKMISKLQDNYFKLAIIRPPMVYGKNSKGNYSKLSKLAKITPIFPTIENKRSMIYIDNLSEFIRSLIYNDDSGTFHPQNREYVKTSEMVRLIRRTHGKKIWLTKLFNPMIKHSNIKTVKKVFGDLIYDQEISSYIDDHRELSFKKTIELTEEQD